MSNNLPQICTASAKANMSHALKQLLYRVAVIYGTLSIYIPVLPLLVTERVVYSILWCTLKMRIKIDFHWGFGGGGLRDG